MPTQGNRTRRKFLGLLGACSAEARPNFGQILDVIRDCRVRWHVSSRSGDSQVQLPVHVSPSLLLALVQLLSPDYYPHYCCEYCRHYQDYYR